MKNGNDTREASPYINYVHHWASAWQKQVPSLLNNYYWCFRMHCYLLLGTSKSLVAKGNRVPQLFPWATIFVVLVQGLQVRRQDQTSERHTYMVPVWNTLEPSRASINVIKDLLPSLGPIKFLVSKTLVLFRSLELPELLIWCHVLINGPQFCTVLSFVPPLRLNGRGQLSFQCCKVDDIFLWPRHHLLMSHRCQNGHNQVNELIPSFFCV